MRLDLSLIGATDGFRHVRVVPRICPGLLQDGLLQSLQFRERVVGAEIEFPRIGGFLGNYIHADGFVGARGRVALPNDGKAIVSRDEAGSGPGVHRVHHDRAIIDRDVVEAGNDESDLASLIELHLMYTRTRAQR